MENKQLEQEFLIAIQSEEGVDWDSAGEPYNSFNSYSAARSCTSIAIEHMKNLLIYAGEHTVIKKNYYSDKPLSHEELIKLYFESLTK